MKRFLLIGHGGCYNRGCEAIIRSTIYLLRREFGSVKIVISSFDYENEKLIDFGNDVTIIPAISNRLWKRFTKDWFIRQFLRIFGKDKIWRLQYVPIDKYLKGVDAVLSVGGDNYAGELENCKYFFMLNNIVKKYGKKLIIWGASIGPFPLDEKLKGVIANLKMVDLITAREIETVGYLKSLGINENVRITADTAFLLPADISGIDEIFYGIDSEVLGFNISPILFNFTSTLKKEEIIKECIIFLRNVIENKKYFVILVPHVTQKEEYNNDYVYMNKIYMALKDTSMIKIISPKYNAMQMKGIISKCQFFIGARTHTTIAALSTGIPTLSIGYSLKAKGINKFLFGHDKFVLDIKMLSSKSLFDKFMQVCSSKDEIKSTLSIQIPVFKELANSNVEYLKQIL